MTSRPRHRPSPILPRQDPPERPHIHPDPPVIDGYGRSLPLQQVDGRLAHVHGSASTHRLSFATNASGDVSSLARVYQTEFQLPPNAGNDVLHIAFAVAYELDHLLTWNCTHIANGATVRPLGSINQRLGPETPVTVTPEELMET